MTSTIQQDIPGITNISSWNKDVQGETDSYVKLYENRDDASLEERKKHAVDLANKYYDLVTDFYEYGWGQSFHFARRQNDETFDQSIRSQELRIADHLSLKPGQRVLDVGCGVGGPMRTIARYSGATIVGLNNNDYQLKRLDIHNKRNGLDHLCSGVKGDFLKMPFEDNSFDAVYAFEATCHAANRVEVYSEIFRVLKPGGKYAMYEWCTTDKYDSSNQLHQDIRHGVEVGDGLPPMYSTQETLKAMKQAKFDVTFARDMVDNGPGMTPWYATLEGKWSLSGLRMSKAGRFLTHNLCRTLEFVGLAPKGTLSSHEILINAATALVESGKLEIFTPMFLVVAVKPSK